MVTPQYAAMVFLSVLAALVLMILIGTNTRLGRDKKVLFLLSAVLLIVSAAAEFFAVYLDGSPEKYRAVHIAFKVFELSVSPFLVIVLISSLNGFRRAAALLPLAVINAALEIFTGFTGFIFYFDAANVYHHNTHYWIYTLIYTLCGIYFFCECVRFSAQYQNRGSASLFAILAFLAAGIGIHSLYSEIRADWLTLTIADALFFIYYISLSEQMDSLTRLLDRKSYDIQIASLRKRAILLVFDIDRFKEINDTYGHETGDACLKTIGAILKKSHGRYGLCYRTGGDEFCVIVTKTGINLTAVNTTFCARLDAARKNAAGVNLPGVSLGYAAFNPKRGKIADAVRMADAMMYQCKRKYRADCEALVPPKAAD